MQSVPVALLQMQSSDKWENGSLAAVHRKGLSAGEGWCLPCVALLQMLLSEKIKEFETTEAELERQIEELQKKHHDARSEIDDYQRRY